MPWDIGIFPRLLRFITFILLIKRKTLKKILLVENILNMSLAFFLPYSSKKLLRVKNFLFKRLIKALLNHIYFIKICSESEKIIQV